MKLTTLLKVFGILTLLGCSTDKQNTFDNGTTGTANGWTQTVLEVCAQITMQNGDINEPVQTTRVYRDGEIAKMNLQWWRAYQEMVCSLKLAFGPDIKEFIEKNNIQSLSVMVQGEELFDNNPEDKPVSIHNFGGWIHQKDGVFSHALISAGDTTKLNALVQTALKANGIDITTQVLADCERGGLVHPYGYCGVATDWSEWNTIKAPTCDTKGQRVRACVIDGCSGEDIQELDVLTGDECIPLPPTCAVDGCDGKPFTVDLSGWKRVNTGLTSGLSVFEGIRGAQGDFSYPIIEPSKNRAHLYTRSGELAKNGDSTLYEILEFCQDKFEYVPNGKFTLGIQPKKGMNHGIGDNVHSNPFKTNYNHTNHSYVDFPTRYFDDFNKTVEPRHTCNNPDTKGSFALHPTNSGGIDVLNAMYAQEYQKVAPQLANFQTGAQIRVTHKTSGPVNPFNPTTSVGEGALASIGGKHPSRDAVASGVDYVGEKFDVWANVSSISGVGFGVVPRVGPSSRFARFNIDHNSDAVRNPRNGGVICYDSIPMGPDAYSVFEVKWPNNIEPTQSGVQRFPGIENIEEAEIVR